MQMDKFRTLAAKLSLSVMLAAPALAMAQTAPDADQDGIPDSQDRCPFDASNQCATNTNTVPEPGALLLVLTAAGAGWLIRRR
jgi:hypothetical protein